MLRTCMATETLIDVYSRLGKPMTKENIHLLCTTACAAPAIFMAPYLGSGEGLRQAMGRDIARCVCAVYGIGWTHPLYKWIETCVLMYDTSTYTDPKILKELIDGIIEMKTRIDKILANDGFPSIG